MEIVRYYEGIYDFKKATNYTDMLSVLYGATDPICVTHCYNSRGLISSSAT